MPTQVGIPGGGLTLPSTAMDPDIRQEHGEHADFLEVRAAPPPAI
ncbi:MAG: hypothetical protein NXH72_11440 [Hyphomonadaceae bacterium]|nr:hypothetical protein [Hyphomonadaceae bacterium]